MTKRELASKIEIRNNLLRVLDTLSKNPAASATISSGGGSKSYTNRDIKLVREEIAALDAEIAEYKRAVLNGGSLNISYARYC